MRTGLYPVKYARAWVESVHRRIPALTGAMWCLGLWDGDTMRGLAVVGRPCRLLDTAARTRIGTVEVIRVAVIEGTPNGCSMLYGACARAGRAMGLDGMLTYVHDDETGVSLRCARCATTGNERRSTMAKYRKRPVVIEAVQYDGSNMPNGVCDGGLGCKSIGAPDGCVPHVHTLEGDMTVSVGDWVIIGVKGERYPCKPDIFAATYEKVDE